jgi:hypothetical protein
LNRRPNATGKGKEEQRLEEERQKQAEEAKEMEAEQRREAEEARVWASEALLALVVQTYVLYWYKSANSDAADAGEGP